MQLPQEHADRIATHETIARDVRRQRQIHGSDHGDVTQFSHTIDGQVFHQENGTMVIFSAETDINFLRDCQHWFADGTFRIAPVGFSQLYTIHGLKKGQCYPCVYALLPNKTEAVLRFKALVPGCIAFQGHWDKCQSHNFPYFH